MSWLTFSSDRVQEVDTAKCSSNAWVDLMSGSRNLHSGAPTNMREDITLAQLDEGKFNVVTVSQEIYSATC